ncbi:Origin recognition complex subunit 2 [Apiotrichum porosum]|uniref:Origin recognition complex subunit 2 n=1 Tax=Apiotrichum porosum TaxID=105984 RepID=A0A427XP35_9TREE|nr:Origin recognition complex subunit 2 [Apiotrichum porosum]RSH80610.1 Origin recognition complex subunit 2 [Apiotrichum porosum]
MPPPARKRIRSNSSEVGTSSPTRKSPPPADDEEASASHLVSFLTGYADRDRGSSPSGSEHSDSDEGEHEIDAESEDDEDENTRTPGRRGLVGTPSRNKRKPAASATPTPRKRGATATPSKDKGKAKATTATEVDEGFLRQTRADTYFLNASRAARTSGLSYAALARPLSQAEYEAAANGARGPDPRVKRAMEVAEQKFPQWAAELEAGFNILLYGYGSKRRTVNNFVRSELATRGHCAVVNGHFPGLGLRDVLAALEDNLGIPDAVAPPAAGPLERAAHRVYAHFSKDEDTHPLFLVLHNIDAPALRTPRALSALALLASSPNIHLIGTFDHVHTPLLFSAAVSNAPPHKFGARGEDGFPPQLRGFNWVYHSVPTFDDYDVELAYARLSAASLGALGQSGAAGVSEEGALQILRSVPPMAARLLKLVLTRQVAALPPDTTSHAAYPPAQTAPAFAMDVDLLQKTARDKFIAREEDRFNALMGEFRDHGLVVVAEVDAEGRTGRWAWVPLGKAAIERILEEMKDVEG